MASYPFFTARPTSCRCRTPRDIVTVYLKCTTYSPRVSRARFRHYSAKYVRGGVAQVVVRCAPDRANERGLLHQLAHPPRVKCPFLCPAVDAIFTFLQPAWVKKQFLWWYIRQDKLRARDTSTTERSSSRGGAGPTRQIANLADTPTGRVNYKDTRTSDDHA